MTHTPTESVTPPRAPEEAVEPGSNARSVGAIVGRYGLLIAWAVVIVLFGVLLPSTFLTGANAANILGSQAVVVVLTLGVL